jgi:hypothetical protein
MPSAASSRPSPRCLNAQRHRCGIHPAAVQALHAFCSSMASTLQAHTKATEPWAWQRRPLRPCSVMLPRAALPDPRRRCNGYEHRDDDTARLQAGAGEPSMATRAHQPHVRYSYSCAHLRHSRECADTVPRRVLRARCQLKRSMAHHCGWCAAALLARLQASVQRTGQHNSSAKMAAMLVVCRIRQQPRGKGSKWRVCPRRV